MSEKQDRQGVRTAMDLERKWQFGKQFAEVMGVATDAQKAITEVNSSLGNVKEQVSSISRSQTEIRQSVSEVTETTEQLKKDVADVELQIKTIEGKFFYIKYSEFEDGHVMTDAPTESTKYMGTCSTDATTAPTDHKKYVWCRIRGADGADGKDGTAGTPGADGTSRYFHVKYSDDGKTFTANNGEALGDWIGTLVNSTEEDSTVFSDYTWKKIVGEDGKNGIDGVDGQDGTSSYFFVKYSVNANGNPMTEAPTDDTKYMGVCSTTVPTAPTDPDDYTWTQCRGNDGTDGTPGATGADGRTQYLHIKYSNDGETFTANDGEELGAWIGTLVDFVEEDSTVFSDYTWKKFTEDVDGELDTLRQTIFTKNTEVLETAEGVFTEALKQYVTKDEHEEYKGSFKTNFDICAEGLLGRVSATEDALERVGDKLERELTSLAKYFSFTINGLEIGATYIDETGDEKKSPNKVIIDNDEISILVSGNPVQTFKADGTSQIPILTITKMLTLLGMEVTEDSTHINWDYDGGV